MISLLNGIKTALEDSGLLESVYLVDHPDVLPERSKLPAAGVCDGGEEPPADTTCGGKELALIARVAIWTPAKDAVGTGLADLLDLSKQVQQLLDRNLLGIDGVIEAHEHGAEATELMELSGKHCMRRTLSFRYQKWE